MSYYKKTFKVKEVHYYLRKEITIKFNSPSGGKEKIKVYPAYRIKGSNRCWFTSTKYWVANKNQSPSSSLA